MLVTHNADIHLSLRGKGGVGRLLGQYFRSGGHAIHCIDTDPVNRTFSQYSGLETSRLELMRDGSIDIRGFDRLMERLLTEDGIFIIDNGASTFIPLWSYIVENQVIDILREAGKPLRTYHHHGRTASARYCERFSEPRSKYD